MNISGDRNAPLTVPPVVRSGVRFEQDLDSSLSGFGQLGGVLSAFDAATHQRLWSLKIYDNRRLAHLEGDAQDVFFKTMNFDSSGRLAIENERGERFVVDIETRQVTLLR
jgi:hypothetical protein